MKTEIKELICIGCPLGCSLKAVLQDGKVTDISGNTCERGAKYARKELTDPRRILTTTVTVKGGHLPVVSVKTETDIPKDQIFVCMKQIKQMEVQAPVCIGQVLVENLAGTKVALVATKEILKIV